MLLRFGGLIFGMGGGGGLMIGILQYIIFISSSRATLSGNLMAKNIGQTFRPEHKSDTPKRND